MEDNTFLSTTLILAVLAIVFLAVAVVILLPQSKPAQDEDEGKQRQKSQKGKKRGKEKKYVPIKEEKEDKPASEPVKKAEPTQKSKSKAKAPVSIEGTDEELLGLVQARETSVVNTGGDKKKKGGVPAPKIPAAQVVVEEPVEEDDNEGESFTMITAKKKKTKEEKKEEEKRFGKKKKMFFKDEPKEEKKSEDKPRKKREPREPPKEGAEATEGQDKAERPFRAFGRGRPVGEDGQPRPFVPREPAPVRNTNYDVASLDEMLTAITSFYGASQHENVFKKLDKKLLVKVLGYLSVKDIAKVARVDHFLQSATKTQSLWVNLNARDFGVAVSSDKKSEKTPRQIYKQHHQQKYGAVKDKKPKQPATNNKQDSAVEQQ